VAWALGVALVAWAWANEATKKTLTARNKPSKRCTEHLQKKKSSLKSNISSVKTRTVTMVPQQRVGGKKNRPKRCKNNPMKLVVKPTIFRKIISMGPDLKAMALSLSFSVRFDWKKVQFCRTTLFRPMMPLWFQNCPLQCL
jgi:hypothetical protein